MKDDLTRLQLELIVQATGDKLNVSEAQGNWVNTKEWDDFIDAWDQLAEYYRSRKGFLISPIALRQYLEITVLLRKILLLEDLEESRVDEITEALLSLESLLNDIVSYGLDSMQREFPELEI